jgi:hypothetical protein
MNEKRLLQIAIALAALAPVTAGIVGALKGTLMLGVWGDAALDSHYRYLSGILLGLGLAFWSCIPDIEKRQERFSLLTLIVVVAGFCRAIGMLAGGPPGLGMTAALAMELIVTPALYLWQMRIAARTPMDA